MKGWQYKAAFVIQFRSGTDLEAGRCAGRVEHVVSHEATRFDSLDELLDFIANVLAEIVESEKP